MSIPGLNEKLAQSRLYVLLSNITSKHTILETAKCVLDGGADVIQLREKLLSDKDFIAVAEDLLNLTARTGAILIINDRVQIAGQIGADGVHIGQDDMEIDEARAILGEKKIIGVSTHNLEQALKAERSGADYIAIGPAFPTKTKDYEPVIGLKAAKAVAGNVKIPIFAIGGVNMSNIDKVLDTGIFRVAISSAIINSGDITNITKEFKDKLLNG
ncbi:MAG: thiamine phosphate synthase [Candidatus Anammoxibacter sp.]